jgi:hypothetical protein
MCFHLDNLLIKIIKSAIIVVNESRESKGIDRKPNSSMYSSVHETPWLQGCILSGMIPAYSRLWYAAVSQPAIDKGRAYFTTLLSKGKSPTARITTKGNRNILWYQHNTQGANSITWLKKRLPKTEILTTSQVIKRMFQFVFF